MSDLVKSLRPLERELKEIETDEVRIAEALSHGEGAEAGVIGVLNTLFELSRLPLEFDPSLGGEAVQLEREKGRQNQQELVEVLRAFRAVIRLYPDILGHSYGGTPEDFEEFRRAVVPKVLGAAAAWAAATRHADDAEKISKVAKRWEAAVG